MKYLKISVFLIAGLVMISCNQGKLEEQQQKISQLEQENEMLRLETIEKESNLNEFFATMGQIRSNLNEIKVRQNLISEETRDSENLGQDVKSQIEDDLKVISKLMDDNRARIASLNRQLRQSNVKIEEFEKLVASLTAEVSERNNEIAMLRDDMNRLNISNDQLATSIEKLEEENAGILALVEQKTDQLNAGWFVFGTRRELRDQQIINRTGGLLGIGKTTVVNSDASKDNFTRIDITRVDKFTIPGKKANLLSLHPNGSYKVEFENEDSATIVIEDREKFWSNTRYLVVSTD